MKDKLELIGGVAVAIAFVLFISATLMYIWTDSDIAPKLFKTTILFMVIVWILYLMLRSFSEDKNQ